MADHRDGTVGHRVRGHAGAGLHHLEAKGGGEFVFGAVRGDLDCRYGPDRVRFTWEGFDEMDPTFGAGSAKLAPDGSLTGAIRFHRGDESTFKARQW